MEQNWEERARLSQNNHQNQFWRWKTFPRTGLGYLKTNIAVLLFGEAPGNDDYATPMIVYHELYTEDQKGKIAIVFDQIVALVPENIDIDFNFTKLLIKADDNEFEYIIFCCRSPTSSNNTYFIEQSGRVYESWQNFLETNRLPHCEYIAPQTGFYQMNGEFQNYQSPAAQQGIISSYADWIASGAVIGCMAGAMLSIAPAAVAVTSVGVGAYGIKQSISSLYDRYSHFESMSIMDRENFFNYVNIAAVGLTGLSSAAISRFENLTASFSNSAVNAIRFLNYTALACDGGLFLFNLYESGNKIINGEFSYSDAFNLTFQTFLMYGAVTNVREMHQILTENSSISSINVTNKKLTKTQKRNLQKRRAKARKRGQPSINETNRVQTMDPRSNLALLLTNGIPLPRSLLRHLYPRAEIIIQEFTEICQLSYSFFIKRSIQVQDFWNGIRYHLWNLYTILEDELKQIKSFFSNYFPNVPSEGNVEQVLNSRFDQVTQGAQDISDMFNEPIENVEVTDESENSDNQIVLTIILLHEEILNTAAHIAFTCQIPETAIAAILIFSDAVMFVTNELLKRNSEYETLYTKNAELLGEEKARKMFEALGTKTTDDLILNDEVLDKDISNILNRIDDFHRNNCNVIDKTDTISPLLHEVVTEFQNFVVEIFLFIVDVPEVHGNNKTAKIIQNISLCLVQKLITSVEKAANDAKILYEVNVKIIGEKLTRDMLRNVGLYADECQMFSRIMEELKEYRNDFAVNILEQDYLSSMSSSEVQPELSIETPENNTTDSPSCGLYIFMSVCDKLCREMNVDTNYSELEKAHIYKRVINFMGHKFLNEMEKSKSHYEQLKFNIETVGPKLFKTMLTKIGLLDEEHSVLLKEVADKLNDYEHLIAEYFEYYEKNDPDLKQIKKWENTISDEGYTAYTVECNEGETDQYYRDFASKLFKINIDDNALLEKNEQVVILKSENKVVFFDFEKQEKNRALIVLIDLCQITEQEDDQMDRTEP